MATTIVYLQNKIRVIFHYKLILSWLRNRARRPITLGNCSPCAKMGREDTWQVDLVCKKMKQLLCLNQIRSKHRTRVAATVRALLIAWALHEDTTTLLRTLLSAHTPPERSVVSSGRLSGRGLDTLRQQVQDSWAAARLQACLPRLRRFLCSRPRRRGHQEGAVRAWLAQRASPRFDNQQQGA